MNVDLIVTHLQDAIVTIEVAIALATGTAPRHWLPQMLPRTRADVAHNLLGQITNINEELDPVIAEVFPVASNICAYGRVCRADQTDR